MISIKEQDKMGEKRSCQVVLDEANGGRLQHPLNMGYALLVQLSNMITAVGLYFCRYCMFHVVSCK